MDSYNPYAGDSPTNQPGMFANSANPQKQPGFLDYLSAFHQAQSQPAQPQQQQSGLMFPWQTQQPQNNGGLQGMGQKAGLCGKLL